MNNGKKKILSFDERVEIIEESEKEVMKKDDESV